VLFPTLDDAWSADSLRAATPSRPEVRHVARRCPWIGAAVLTNNGT